MALRITKEHSAFQRHAVVWQQSNKDISAGRQLVVRRGLSPRWSLGSIIAPVGSHSLTLSDPVILSTLPGLTYTLFRLCLRNMQRVGYWQQCFVFTTMDQWTVKAVIKWNLFHRYTCKCSIFAKWNSHWINVFGLQVQVHTANSPIRQFKDWILMYPKPFFFLPLIQTEAKSEKHIFFVLK